MAQRRIYPPVYFFGCVLVMIALHYWLPVARWVAGPWRYCGVLPIVAGAAAALHVNGMFRRHATTIRPFQESDALVTEGLFQFSRNPIYLGMIGVVIGVACLLGSLTPLIVPPILAWILATRIIRVEERMLEQRFGREYTDYKGRVNRWFGRNAPRS